VADGLSAARAGSPHSRKFFAVIMLLAAIAIAAIGVAIGILLDGGGSSKPASAWSDWSPPDGGIAGEREIASVVAPLYRASPASQLAIVTVQNVNSSATNATGEQVAVRDPNSGTLSPLPGTTAVYSLCGLGAGCEIPVGSPSIERFLLLRREALELALYTFKYISGIDNVVAILPPGRSLVACTRNCPKTKKPATKAVDLAIGFGNQVLKTLLDKPVRDTLPEQVPPLPDQIDVAPEAELVSVVTSHGLFTQQLIQSQDGSQVLVLDPLPPQ
jgi:hypothetical protein